MPANPPENMPRITSNVFYDDPASALEWLAKAFGFETQSSIPGPDGSIMHAEMKVEDSKIMMSPTAASDHWKSPKSLSGSVRHLCAPLGRVSNQAPARTCRIIGPLSRRCVPALHAASTVSR